MKYLIGFIAIVILVRIDFFLSLVDKGMEKLNRERPTTTQPDIEQGETIPVTEDKNLKVTSKTKFLNLLQNFRINPEPTVRELAMELLRSEPMMFGSELDPNLESAIFSWRDLISQGNTDLPNFLLELMTVLEGKNLEVVRRFFSLMMDQDMKSFLLHYSRSKDINCSIGIIHGDVLESDQLYSVLEERDLAISRILSETNVDPNMRALGQNCQIMIRAQLGKMTPPTPPAFFDPSED